MAFPLEILKSGIKTASNLTKGVQVKIEIKAYVGESTSGVKLPYSSPKKYSAIVNLTRRTIPDATGKLITISGTVTILSKVEPNGSVTSPPRREPIDPRDRIVIEGKEYPINSAPGSIISPEGGGLITKIRLA